MPRHVGIIMDGNGRWAKARGLPRIAGHRQGKKVLEGVIEAAHELGIDYVTLYAFSSENWQRPQDEVKGLMALLSSALEREIAKLSKKGVRLRIMGDRNGFSPKLQAQFALAEEKTALNERITVILALNYGGRQEIVQAIKRIVEQVGAGEVQGPIDEVLISKNLYAPDIPDPDLIIRTSGEHRLSNFLLWQSAYAELFFSQVLWPDFTGEHLKDIIHQYSKRERRYGKTSEQL